tara:strand:+ start:132 stop:737 length:606 start_codon:yes stop_codon:yes gene_type:complete
MSSIKLTADSGGGTFEIKAPSSSGNTRVLTLPDTGNLTLGGGKILQVKSFTKTDSQSTTTTNSFTDIVGFSLSITPSSASSKIFVQTALQIGASDNSFLGFKVLRDSTAIGLNGGAEASGNIGVVAFGYGYSASNVSYRGRGVSWQHLDTPGDTNSHTYKLQFASLFNNQAVYINRPHNLDTNYSYTILGSSSFTLMEVGA